MKERRNISLDSRVHAMAQRIMEKQGHADFSGFVEELIRREHDVRFPPENWMNKASPRYLAGPTPFNVLEKEMAALGIKPEISSAPGVSAAASAGAASAARLVAPESLPTPATGAPSGHTRGPKPAAAPAP